VRKAQKANGDGRGGKPGWKGEVRVEHADLGRIGSGSLGSQNRDIDCRPGGRATRLLGPGEKGRISRDVSSWEMTLDEQPDDSNTTGTNLIFLRV
jgi:hypothetical protein